MRLLLLIPIFLINTWYLSAQSPNKMSFQAVIRDSTGGLVVNQSVGLRMSILQGTITGSSIYKETHSTTTNSSGLISIEIGGGTSSDNFSGIDWSNGPYYLKREVDPDGGTNYIISGTSQLMSVPYAMYATMVDTVLNAPDTSSTNEIQNLSVSTSGDTLYISGGNYIVVPGISLNNNFDTVTTLTGKIWMDRNLGASQVATSGTDAASYGDLYQWGRLSDGHEDRASGITNTKSTADDPMNSLFITSSSDWRNPPNDNLWQGVDGVNNPCPTGYRLPTEAEWEAERMSWSSNNAAGAFASPLKLPLAGARLDNNGSLISVGTLGDYWSSTVNGVNARALYFDSNAYMNTNTRAFGFSVRCIKD